MTATRIIQGVVPGQFYEQPGASFVTAQWGFDTGRRSWLTHPSTPESSQPQRGQVDAKYRSMYITDVTPQDDESGLVLLTASYRGLKWASALAKERITPDCDVAMFTLPALQSSGSSQKVKLVAPIPKPKLSREYVTTTPPTYTGVSAAATGAAFLPDTLPSFSVSYIPDPDEPLTLNYGGAEWRLDSRTWEQPVTGAAVWFVRERYSYYQSLAV